MSSSCVPCSVSRPSFEDKNLVGMSDGGQPVRHHERRAVFHEGVDRALHQPLRFGVQRGRGLVEDENGGFLSRARAMEMRWRWPPDSITPRSPMTVESPLGIFSINSRACAAFAASDRLCRAARRLCRSDIVLYRIVEQAPSPATRCRTGCAGRPGRTPLCQRRRWRWNRPKCRRTAAASRGS